MSKVVLITGASRRFGKIWAEAFLKRGNLVVLRSHIEVIDTRKQ